MFQLLQICTQRINFSKIKLGDFHIKKNILAYTKSWNVFYVEEFIEVK